MIFSLYQNNDDGTPPPQKITKIAIDMDKEEPKYEYVTKVRCYGCNGAEEAKESTPKVSPLSFLLWVQQTKQLINIYQKNH